MPAMAGAHPFLWLSHALVSWFRRLDLREPGATDFLENLGEHL